MRFTKYARGVAVVVISSYRVPGTDFIVGAGSRGKAMASEGADRMHLLPIDFDDGVLLNGLRLYVPSEMVDLVTPKIPAGPKT